MKYKILRPGLYWKNRLMQAELVIQPETYLSLSYDIWETDSLDGIMPLLTYKTAIYPSMPDFIATEGVMWLFSQRFLDLLKDYGIFFESLPIILLDKKTKTPSNLQYELFHLQQIVSIVDTEKSDITGMDNIQKIALRQLDPAPEFSMVRDCFLRSQVFVRDDLREKMEEERITGCYWMEVEDFKFVINKRPWET